MEILQLHSVYKLSEVILQLKSYKGYWYHPPDTSKAFTYCLNIPVLQTAQLTTAPKDKFTQRTADENICLYLNEMQLQLC